MLCIRNADENLAAWEAAEQQEAWLGYTDRTVEGTYEWVSGCASTYTNWGSGEPNNYGGDEDYAVLCPTYFANVKGWCDWGMGGDHHLCICQTDDDSPSEAPFISIINCDNTAATGHTLGGIGWVHWMTFHFGNNGFQALDKNNGYQWNTRRSAQLWLTAALAILMTAGGSLLVDKCTCHGTNRDLGITYVVFGVWGILWTTLSLAHLASKGMENPPPPPPPPPAPPAPPAVVVAP